MRMKDATQMPRARCPFAIDKKRHTYASPKFAVLVASGRDYGLTGLLWNLCPAPGYQKELERIWSRHNRGHTEFCRCQTRMLKRHLKYAREWIYRQPLPGIASSARTPCSRAGSRHPRR